MNDQSFSSNPSGRSKRAGRKPRADGVESRRAILHAAATLATTRGLEGLSLGELAQHIGMSKSGLFAHFKSKEELELAAVETAAEVFAAEVLRPAADSPRGLARVVALGEAFLGHLQRRVFPGGCFFAAVSVQLAASPGRPRDRVMEFIREWQAQFTDALGQAHDSGELPRGADIDQLAFEVTAMLVRANFTWVVSGDPHVLDQARTGIKNTLGRAGGKSARTTRSSGKRAAPSGSRG
ncbi:MAG TPA: TetR/AcrR family transcriptional regulator [Gemmataceae bacterium]